jgi:hypothetical protein
MFIVTWHNVLKLLFAGITLRTIGAYHIPVLVELNARPVVRAFTFLTAILRAVQGIAIPTSGTSLTVLSICVVLTKALSRFSVTFI